MKKNKKKKTASDASFEQGIDEIFGFSDEGGAPVVDGSAISHPETARPPVEVFDNPPQEIFEDPDELSDDVAQLRKSRRFNVKSVRMNGARINDGRTIIQIAKDADESRSIQKTEKKKVRKNQKEENLFQQPNEAKTVLKTVFSQEKGVENSGIKVKERPKSKKLNTMDYVRYVMLFMCFTVFLYSTYTLVESLISRAQGRAYYDKLSQLYYGEDIFAGTYLLASSPNTPSVDLLSAYGGVEQEIQLPDSMGTNDSYTDQMTKIKRLKALNKDTVGWIVIPGTNINYPVVQGKDNDYYLRRNFEGRSQIAGSLFVDSRNSKLLMENRNTVIYGHNMNDGSMFNNLHDFRKEEVFKNGKIEITTVNGVFVYEVFSVHEAHETSEYFQTEFADDGAFAQYLEQMQTESLYKKEGLELSTGDRVLTLSTCLDPIMQSEYRWAVHAKLVQVINYTP